MKNLILSLADRVLQGGAITCQEAEQLIDVSDDDTMLLLAMEIGRASCRERV